VNDFTGVFGSVTKKVYESPPFVGIMLDTYGLRRRFEIDVSMLRSELVTDVEAPEAVKNDTLQLR